MAGIRIEGNTSGRVVEVTTAQELKVALDTGSTPANVGAVRAFSENDPGSVTGEVYLKSPETSSDFRLRVGLDNLLFGDTFNATAQNTGTWKHLFTTMTATMAGGSVLFNANSTATTTTGCMLQTWQHFPMFGASGLYWEATGQITSAPLANQNYCAGFGLGATATVEPTDGIYFRLNSGGLYGVVKFNGSETVAQLLTASIPASTNAKYVIAVNQREVEFWVDDVLMADIETPNAQAQMNLCGSLPAFFQFYNSGTVTGAPQMQVKVGTVNISLQDLDCTRQFSHQMSAMGLAYQGLNGGTMGTLAAYANSANPTAAVPTNTTAALGSGLGGQFWHTNTLALNTDGIVCSYQNPAGGVNQTPRQLVISKVRIDTAVQTTLANAGGAVYVWGLAYGHTAVSLGTAESASFANNTAKAPRRVPIGVQTAVGALAQGSLLQTLDLDLDQCPIVVNPGEFVAVFVKNIGTVGTAGVLHHHVFIGHHFV